MTALYALRSSASHIKMEPQDFRSLQILEEIDTTHSPSQRYLARKLNISLGLANSFVKRLAKKGRPLHNLVKIANFCNLWNNNLANSPNMSSGSTIPK